MHTQVVKIIIFTVHSYKSPFCWCHLSQLQSSSPIHMLLFNDTVTVVSLEILLLWLPSCPWSLVPRSTKTSIWPLYFGGVNHALKTMASEHRTTLTDAAEPGVGGWRCWMVEAHYTAIAITKINEDHELFEQMANMLFLLHPSSMTKSAMSLH